MRHSVAFHPAFFFFLLLVILALMLLTVPRAAHGRPTIRAAFFVDYPSAVGTRLDNLPSVSAHCGLCHYDFHGGGARNPYGAAVEAALRGSPKTDAGRQAAIASVANLDQDGDGVASATEILDRATYSNTPTLPGLTPANVGQVANVDVNDILKYLVPVYGADMLPPSVPVTVGRRVANRDGTLGGGARDLSLDGSGQRVPRPVARVE